LPNWLVRLGALIDPTLRTVVPLLTAAKAERMLGWRTRSPEDAIVATAESLIRFGSV